MTSRFRTELARMKYAWLVVGVLAGHYLATAIQYPPLDGDQYWQRWLGEQIVRHHALPHALGSETFTAPGAPWVPQEWLFSTLLYALGPAGRPAFAVLIALAATAALVVAAYTAARREAHPVAIAAAVACAGVATFESFGVRAQVLAWPFVAAFLLAIDVDGPGAYAAIVVTALWSNVHGSAMLAPAIAAVAAAGAFADDRRGWRARRLAIVAAGCAVATCANPLGWRLPAYAVTLFSSPFKDMITEWGHTSVANYAFVLGALPLLLPMLAFGLRDWRERGVMATFAYLLLAAARNISLFGIAALPSAACALTRGVPRLATSPVAAARRLWLEPALGAVLAGVLGVAIVSSGRATAAGGDFPPPPAAALAAIERLPGRHDVFCADFAWCSELIGDGRERVFLDGRADPYPLAVWQDYAAIVRVRPQWRARLRARNVDVVLVGRKMALEQLLATAPEWRPVYGDATYRVWRRDADVSPTVARR